MASFIYDIDQKYSINLENVDCITCTDDSGKFFINFFKDVGINEQSISGMIGRWTYTSKEERDIIFYEILSKNGMDYSKKA